MNSSRVGLYAWGGPGTVRLLKTKYFSPTIDERSFSTLYDAPFLNKAKDIFGVTDIWVTFSWGFSDETEREDRSFIAGKMENFQKASIRTQGYVQGFNLVTQEFAAQDLFCRGPKGGILPYSKGRACTCPNNPNAVRIIRRRIENALSLPFDGIYVDNMLFGLPPLYVYKDRTSFFGCSCRYCQKQFKSLFGYSLPMGGKKGEGVISDYLVFREETMRRVISDFCDLVRKGGREFGINLYDPWWHSPEYYFGYRVKDIEQYLSYFLVENHALSKHSINNTHLTAHLATAKKPTFVVSYRNGIGRDSTYTQSDFDRIKTEAVHLGYAPCYKATEYKTKGVWHALPIDRYIRPARREYVSPSPSKSPAQLSGVSRVKDFWLTATDGIYNWFTPRIHERKALSRVFIESPLYTRVVKKRRIYT